MLDRSTHQAHTAHTLNLVRSSISDARRRSRTPVRCRISRPTMLTLMGLPHPGMTASRLSRSRDILVRIALLCISTLLCMHNVHANQQEVCENLRQRNRGSATGDGKTIARNPRQRTRCVNRNGPSAPAIASGISWPDSNGRGESHAGDSFNNNQSKLSPGKCRNSNCNWPGYCTSQYLGGKQELFLRLLNNHDPNQAARRIAAVLRIHRASALSGLRTCAATSQIECSHGTGAAKE